MHVPVRLLSPTARLPERAHPEDAAFDLCADQELTLEPGGRAVVATGIALALPDGSCGLVLPRSGLAARHGITVLNAPGLIDAGYRGEVKVILLNTDREQSFRVQPGERIAQLLIAQAGGWQLRALATELSASARGQGGLGSTGR